MTKQLLGYNITEQLYSGDKLIVSRALRKSDNLPVVLKLLKIENPNPNDIARLSREYDLLKRLNIPEVIQPLGFENQQNRVALVLESVPNSVTLRTFLHTHKLNIEKFLRLATQMAGALDKIHEAGIIHKDINPDNILVLGEGDAIKILDFNLAVQLQEEKKEIINAEQLKGTLAYISPEQTTRMNRTIDRRSDLYSLGVTFYEMLTGHLPFDAKDANEWVYNHISKPPIEPHNLVTSIPLMLSEIILKLLAKLPEDRYTTALGLKADLDVCLLKWQNNQEIPKFALGTKDHKGLFQIPQKLYGREIETQELLTTFDYINKGHRKLLLITGDVEVGKSSLINEVQKSIVKHHGYYTSGKYERYNREVPYAGLAQAFSNLINQILASNKQRIDIWRQEILKALASNAQVIMNVIPELEILIGKQPSVVELPPAESRTRFEMVFFDFVSAFAKKEHPLVIFIDDLQWADVGSFNLISQLMINPDLKYFLLIGTYQDNEVSATHPLSKMLETFNKDEIPFTEIKLKPLTIENIKQLITDTLPSTSDIQSLTRLVKDKTAGNPYFVNLLLTTLYKTQQIKFDGDHWVFDIDTIKRLPITANIVDLISSELSTLSPETQELLKFAACIGNDFDIESLMAVTGKSSEEITALLWPALQDKWIFQLGESFKYGIKNNDDKQVKIYYRFSQDIIKHTLYSLTAPSVNKELHYKLGKHLLNEYREDHNEKLFMITQHFSACLDLIQDPAEKLTIAKLFNRAADKMKAFIAYDMAIKHYKYALELLGPNKWDQHCDLTTTIYTNLGIVKFLNGSFEKGNEVFDELIQKLKKPLDKAKVYNARALSYAAEEKYPDTIKACEDGLRVLGLNMPKSPSKFLLLTTWIKIKWHLRNKNVNDLLDLPIMQDPHKIMTMELLEKLANVAFVTTPTNFNKTGYAIMLAVLYSMKYGNHTNSSVCYAMFGQIEVINDNLQRAYQFAELAIKLCDRFQNANLAMVYLISIMRIFPWKLPYKEIINYANKSFELSYKNGQLYCYQLSAIGIVATMNLANLPATDIDKKIIRFLADPQVNSNHDIKLFLDSSHYMLQALQSTKTLDDYYEFRQGVNKENIKLSLVNSALTLHEIVLAYYTEDWERGKKILEETKDFLEKPLNTVSAAPVFYFYTCLFMLSFYPQLSYFKRRAYQHTLKRLLAQLKFWESHCAANYSSTYHLIKAGVAAVVDNNINQALLDYEIALGSARQTDRVLIQAVAHEFIGRIFLNRQQPRTARCYLQDAFVAYQQAGFTAKLEILKNNNPEILSHFISPIKSSVTSHHSTSILDIDTVLKSAQTISSQMKLEKLLETLITIVMENAGAQRSLLLLVENDKLIIEAEGRTDAKPRILQKESIESRDDLPLSIIQYVQNTQEPIVLGNASEDGAYTEDNYVIQNKPCSILCAPILYKNYLFGILYLENNLVCDAFTQKHLELLKVLSSQIAISLENARLYSAYDQFIPHEFLDILGKHSIIDITLGDNVQKEMSVLFSDIRGFSKLSEQLGPQDIFKFMNDYLGHMAPIIKNHGGFIDKYIGDAIMALFTKDVSSAISAAIDMQKELANFNQGLIEEGKQPIAIGIGINSGNLTLGTLGGLNRIETSVLSDAVNVAELIQDLTKTYDCRLLISGTAYQKLTEADQFDLRFIDRTSLLGKDEIIDIWEVYNGDPDDLRYAKLAIAKHYNEAIDFFLNKSYQKALTLFQRCLVSLPNDKVIAKYIASCEKLLNTDQNQRHPEPSEGSV